MGGPNRPVTHIKAKLQCRSGHNFGCPESLESCGEGNALLTYELQYGFCLACLVFSGLWDILFGFPPSIVKFLPLGGYGVMRASWFGVTVTDVF